MNFITFIQGGADHRNMDGFEFVTGTRHDNIAAYERKCGSEYCAINKLSYDIDQMYDGYEDICIGDDGKLYTVMWLYSWDGNKEIVKQPGYLRLEVKPNEHGARLGMLYWRGEHIANATFGSFEHAAKIMNDECELSDWIEHAFFG